MLGCVWEAALGERWSSAPLINNVTPARTQSISVVEASLKEDILTFEFQIRQIALLRPTCVK